ncbi:hypothetical protein Plhal304r1_c004g0018461 [Plasmopara halstedii]
MGRLSRRLEHVGERAKHSPCVTLEVVVEGLGGKDSTTKAGECNQLTVRWLTSTSYPKRF